MAYVPPTGDAVLLIFAAYTSKPPAPAVVLEFDPAAVGDILQTSVGRTTEFGSQRIELRSAFVRPAGLAPPPIQGHVIDRVAQRAFPSGFVSSTMSTPEYVRWDRWLYPTGWISNEIWPLGTMRLKWLGGYQPPPGLNTVLEWPGLPYSPPPGVNVVLEFGSLGYGRIAGATAFDQSAFGTPAVVGDLLAYPSGISSAALGLGSISLLMRVISIPRGIHDESFGLPATTNQAFAVYPGGILSTPTFTTLPGNTWQVTTPLIDYRTKELVPSGIAPSVVVSTATAVTHFFQLTYPSSVSEDTAPQAALIDYRLKTIEADYIAFTSFGAASVVRAYELAPLGIEPQSVVSVFAFVAPRERELYPIGAPSSTAGSIDHEVFNRNRRVFAVGFDSESVVAQQVFPNPRAILPDVLGLAPASSQVSTPFLRFRTTTVHPDPWPSSRFAFYPAHIENLGQGVAPEGFDTAEVGDAVATHFLQLVYPEVERESHVSYPVVGNTARVVSASGARSDAHIVERPTVYNTRQFLQLPWQSAIPSADAYGTPFIAFRERTIAPVGFDTARIIHPTGWISPYPIPLAPASWDSAQFALPFVWERFNRIFPVRLPNHTFGELAIANRNRELHPWPIESSPLYERTGNAIVELYIRYLPETSAGDQSNVPRAWIRDRRTWVGVVPSILPPFFPLTHWVRLVQPDLPSNRSLFEVSAGDFAVVPQPVAASSVLLPDGIEPPNLTPPIVYSGVIRTRLGFISSSMGSLRIELFHRRVTPRAVPWPRMNDSDGSSDLNWVKPRLSPYTIYAPSADQASEQARRNHPGPPPHRIDQGLSDQYGQWSADGGWPWFGLATVLAKNRAISNPSAGHSPTTFGSAEVTLRNREIYAQGFDSLRRGRVIFWGIPQTVDLDSFSLGLPPTWEFGTTAVTRPAVFDPYLYASGHYSLEWGDTRIELRNRDILVPGIFISALGQTSLGWTREFSIPGFEATIWGTTWASHRIREFALSGWDSTSMKFPPDWVQFNLRMRVMRVQ